jgi:hypothetical protein
MKFLILLFSSIAASPVNTSIKGKSGDSHTTSIFAEEQKSFGDLIMKELDKIEKMNHHRAIRKPVDNQSTTYILYP